jgi:predicted TIM-barrel fold metal-dependent hydrolase
MISRRQSIAVMASAASAWAARPAGVLIESHVHLFAGDPVHFPYSPASYKPPPEPVEEYVKFATQAKIAHAVIVHPEPYQDDHRYLEYAFSKEPFPGFFKGTCLFDPIDANTPKRMQALVRANPGRIVALRIHEVSPSGTPPTKTGLISGRDLRDPQMLITWRAAHALGLSIQMHFIPCYAPQIGELAAKFRDMPIILDHLARPGQGTPQEYEQVLQLAKLPRVVMKYTNTGVESASKTPYPHLDAKPLVKRVYEAFGPDRIVWGSLGNNLADLDRSSKLLDIMFDFAPETDRAKIRALNARKLYAFS